MKMPGNLAGASPATANSGEGKITTLSLSNPLSLSRNGFIGIGTTGKSKTPSCVNLYLSVCTFLSLQRKKLKKNFLMTIFFPGKCFFNTYIMSNNINHVKVQNFLMRSNFPGKCFIYIYI